MRFIGYALVERARRLMDPIQLGGLLTIISALLCRSTSYPITHWAFRSPFYKLISLVLNLSDLIHRNANVKIDSQEHSNVPEYKLAITGNRSTDSSLPLLCFPLPGRICLYTSFLGDDVHYEGQRSEVSNLHKLLDLMVFLYSSNHVFVRTYPPSYLALILSLPTDSLLGNI